MGVAASVSSEDHKADIVKSLKEVYDSHQHLSNDDMQKKLQEQYSHIIHTKHGHEKDKHHSPLRNSHGNITALSTELGDVAASGATPTSVKSSRGFLDKQQSGRAGKKKTEKSNTTTDRPARRRSFDGVQKKAPMDVAALAASLSTTALPSVSEAATVETHAADSWDSVTEQPFCDVCNMAFKSTAFLERHKNFSSLHQDNVKRKETGEKGILVEPPKLEEEEEEKEKEKEEVVKVVVRQEEGTHYRLLYSGCKFFWRIQLNVDIDVYHHFLAQAIEIIPFHTQRHKELPRIYLDYENVQNLVRSSVDEALEAKVKTILENRFADKPDKAKLRAEIELQKVVTFILQHMNMTAIELPCEYVTLSGDNEDDFPVLEEPPVILVPIHIMRRRQSTVEEFKQVMKTVSNDYNEISSKLAQATNELSVAEVAAEQKDGNSVNPKPVHEVKPERTKANYEYASKIANHVYEAARYLSEKKWYAHFALPKQRFIKAVRKIIFRAAVLKSKQTLVSKHVPYIARSPYRKSTIRITKKPGDAGLATHSPMK